MPTDRRSDGGQLRNGDVALVAGTAGRHSVGIIWNHDFAVVIRRKLLIGWAGDHRVGAVFQRNHQHAAVYITRFIGGDDGDVYLGFCRAICAQRVWW